MKNTFRILSHSSMESDTMQSDMFGGTCYFHLQGNFLLQERAEGSSVYLVGCVAIKPHG
jgi:hypothetical protein